MKIGQTYETEIIVTKEMLASSLGSGLVDVFATPCMIARMEENCSLLVKDFIGEENVTVGFEVNVKHLAASPLGMKITFISEFIESDGKIIKFKVEAFDKISKISEGIHTRAIVNKAKFEARANAKKI